MLKVKLYLFTIIFSLFYLSDNSKASCISSYNEVINHKKSRTTLLGVSVPLTGSSSVYVGYLSVSSTSNQAIYASMSSTTSSTLLAAGTILSATTVVGEIITLKDLLTCKKLIQQSKISLGKELTEFTEEIKKRNDLVILPIEHVAKIINDLDSNYLFCPSSKPLPLNKNKIMNLVEDELNSQYGLLEN
tara:strand:+ start:8130 stop:8696 length:567 start_codon:yes stop_codon:yes gene_type:complete